MPELLNPSWFDYPLDSLEASREAQTLCNRLWTQNAPLRLKARKNLENYYGCSWDRSLYNKIFKVDDDTPLVFNLTKSFVSTVVSRVGASDDPKVQFVTSNADWKTQRKAKKLDQFVDALTLQPCPPYQNQHEQRYAVVRDACLFSRGAVQVSADVDQGKILSERILPWELLSDLHDSRYGAPTEVARIYPISRHKLSEWFPDRASEIDEAPMAKMQELELELGLEITPTVSYNHQVQINEIWLMAPSAEVPGRHLMQIDGVEKALIDEEYSLPYPPFAILYWDHPIAGTFSESLADEVRPLETEINHCLMRLQDSARRTSLNIICYPEGMVDPATLEKTEDCINIPFQGAVAPVVTQAQALNPSMVSWVQMLKSVANDLCGVSEMAQTGSHSEGVDSGKAIRAEAGQQSLRFAWLSKQIENYQLIWARLAIYAIRTIAEEDPEFYVKWPGAGFLKTIKWSDVDLNDDQFVLQIYSVGGEKNTPPDRLQRAEELYSAGVISLRAYEAITEGSQDIQSQTRSQNVQQEYMSQLIDRWLDASEEQLADPDGWFDKKRGIKLIPPPISYLAVSDAILQVALAYLQAQIDGAPDANQQCFLTWLEMADRVLQQQQERQAKLQAMAKGAGQAPGGAPGMPQQAPPPAAQ